MKIYRNGSQVADVKPLDSSYVKEAVMGENSLFVEFYSTAAIDLKRGDYCSVFSRSYFIAKVPIPEIVTGVYKYSMTMISVREKTKEALLMQFGSPEVVYTCTPLEFLQLVVQSLQRVQPTVGWAVGDCITGELLTLSFSDQSCYDALNSVCGVDNWNTEWYAEGYTVHLKRQEFTPVGLSSLSIGNGLKTLTADNGDKEYYTRLYAFGSTKNMADGKRLAMDIPYIDAANAPIVIEKVVRYDDIYPRLTNATVTGIPSGTINKFMDSNLTFNPAENRIEGLAMHVVFLSGALVGLDFEANYDGTTFSLITYTDEGGITWPSASVKPAIGDKYVIYNITMPVAYTTAAKAELAQRAQVDINKMSKEPISVNADTSDAFFVESGYRLRLGDLMTVSHDTIPVLIGGRQIRLVEFKRYLNSDYRYDSVKFSDVVYSNPVTAAQNAIEQTRDLIYKAGIDNPRYTARNWRDSQELFDKLNGAIGNFTGAINPVSVQTMMLLLGDESLQYRFVNSKTTPQTLTHSFAYNATTKKLTTAAGIIQHMTLGVDSLKSAHAVSEYKFWDTPLYDSGAIIDETKSYWLYLSCNKTTAASAFSLQENTLALDGGTTYNLLVGFLNSEFEGDRGFTPLYGFSSFSPGRLVVNKIMSADGDGGLIIDLVNKYIQGSIKFTNGVDAKTAVENVQGTADSKRRVFVLQPTSTQAYDVGDLWVNATYYDESVYYENEQLRCNTAKAAGAAFNISHWIPVSEAQAIAMAANTAANEAKYYLQMTVDPTLAALQNQIDGQIESHFKEYNPTTANLPASAWTTDALKQQHANDTFTNTLTGGCWRWQQSGGVWGWGVISDTATQQALTAAARAQDTADGKRRVFVAQPTNAQAYDVGDLWVNATFGETFTDDFLKCKTAKAAGAAFSISHWEPASAAQLMAKESQYLKEAIEDGSVDVDGGLLLSNLMMMKDTNGNVVGGMSGIANDPVGMWTGGTHEEALAGLAKIILRKDGTGVFSGIIKALGGSIGDFDIIGNTIGSKNVQLTNENIEALSTLLTPTTLNYSQQSIWTNTATSETINPEQVPIWVNLVARSYTQVMLTPESDSQISFRVGGTVDFLPRVNSCRRTVYIRKNNVNGEIVYTDDVYGINVTSDNTLNKDIQKTLPAGSYVIELILQASVKIEYLLNPYAFSITSKITGYSGASQIAISGYYTKTKLGNDGFYSYWSNTLYFYLSQLAGLKYRGAADMPGVGLCGGRVAADGVHSVGWGSKVGGSSRSGNLVTITHTINDTAYSIRVSPEASVTWYWTSKQSGSIQVYTSSNVAFEYELIRTV